MEASRKTYRTKTVDAAGLQASAEFFLKLKKQEIEQAGQPTLQQILDLNQAAKNVHRARNNPKFYKHQMKLFEKDMAAALETWRSALGEVDRIPGGIWTNARLVTQPDSPKMPVMSMRSEIEYRQQQEALAQQDQEGSEGSASEHTRQEKAGPLLRAPTLTDAEQATVQKEKIESIAAYEAYRKYRGGFNAEFEKFFCSYAQPRGPRSRSTRLLPTHRVAPEGIGVGPSDDCRCQDVSPRSRRAGGIKTRLPT